MRLALPVFFYIFVDAYFCALSFASSVVHCLLCILFFSIKMFFTWELRCWDLYLRSERDNVNKFFLWKWWKLERKTRWVYSLSDTWYFLFDTWYFLFLFAACYMKSSQVIHLMGFSLSCVTMKFLKWLVYTVHCIQARSVPLQFWPCAVQKLETWQSLPNFRSGLQFSFV